MKSFETGLTRLETLTKAGRKPVHVPLAKVEDRIHAAQLVLPFNSTRCEQGLAALREFRRDWDDKQKVFKLKKAGFFNSLAFVFIVMDSHWKHDLKWDRATWA